MQIKTNFKKTRVFLQIRCTHVCTLKKSGTHCVFIPSFFATISQKIFFTTISQHFHNIFTTFSHYFSKFFQNCVQAYFIQHLCIGCLQKKRKEKLVWLTHVADAMGITEYFRVFCNSYELKCSIYA